jgi:hypothetical protein
MVFLAFVSFAITYLHGVQRRGSWTELLVLFVTYCAKMVNMSLFLKNEAEMG